MGALLGGFVVLLVYGHQGGCLDALWIIRGRDFKDIKDKAGIQTVFVFPKGIPIENPKEHERSVSLVDHCLNICQIKLAHSERFTWAFVGDCCLLRCSVGSRVGEVCATRYDCNNATGSDVICRSLPGIFHLEPDFKYNVFGPIQVLSPLRSEFPHKISPTLISANFPVIPDGHPDEYDTYSGKNGSYGGYDRHVTRPLEHALLRFKIVLGSLVFVSGLYFYVNAFSVVRPHTSTTRVCYALLGTFGVLGGGMFCLNALFSLL